MESKQVLKGVIESLSEKTGSGYAEDDLIQIYANDGTPNGKIPRSALMSCVKDSLGALLNQGAADLGTSLAKIPALNSGGTLGSATVANLASVLGESWVEPFPQFTPTDGNHTISELGLGIFSVYHFGIYSDLPPITGLLAETASGMVIRVLCTSSQIMTFAFIESGELFVRYSDTGAWAKN